MDPQLSDEQRALRDLASSFVEREVIPREFEIERAGAIPRDLLDALGALGFFGLNVPEVYGGLDVGTVGYALVCEAFGRSHGALRALMSVQNGIGVRAIVTAGTEAQRQRWLPDLASGRARGCFCLSEPGAGSDAAAMSTTATRTSAGWVLEGQKHFITWAPDADLFTVWALTDRSKRARGGVTAFVVEKGTPGLRIGRIHPTMGNTATTHSEVFFDACEVPDEHRLGEVGQGFRLAMNALDTGRISIAAAALGAAKRLLAMSASYAKDRHTFGHALADYQAIQWMLADTATDIFATECMVYETARRHEAGQHTSQSAAMCKLFASEMAFRAADRALQIHGGLGYTRDLPIERMFRDLRLLRIVEGTSEIQRLIIARGVLGE